MTTRGRAVLAFLMAFAISARVVPATCPPVDNIVATGLCQSIEVLWVPVPGAIEYRVLRNTVNSTSGATNLGTVTTNFMTDSSPPIGQLLYYIVQVRINPTPSCPFGLGPFYGPATATAIDVPPAPSVTVTSRPCDVLIEWTSVPYANAYAILYGTTPDPAAASLLGFSSTFQRTVVTNQQWYYWIEARGICGNSPRAGGNPGLPTDIPAPVTGLAASDGTECDQVTLTWNAAARTDFYRVEREDPDSLEGEWILLGTTTATQFTDPNPLPIPWRYQVTGVNAVCSLRGQSAIDFGAPWDLMGAATVPAGVVAATGTSAIFSVPMGVPAGSGLTWLRNGLPLADGGRISGAATPTLTIASVRLDDVARYAYRLNTPCAETSPDAVLGVTVPCRADFNDSGAVSPQDIFDFLAAFFAGCP